MYTRIRSKKPADHEEYSTYIVYHILGAGVLEDPRYKEFMNGFDDSVHVSREFQILEFSEMIYSFGSILLVPRNILLTK